jgi:type II secretory pathway pseudopilin PulG
MEYAQGPPQPRHRYFVKYFAIATAIFLFAASCVAQTPTAGPEVPGVQENDKGKDKDADNPALLAEFGQLMKKLRDGVHLPAARSQSRLLPLLPEETVFYSGLPNYGEASHQVLTIVQQELKENADLRAWFEKGQWGEAWPKVEDTLEKIYQLSQYLGDELAVSGATKGSGKDPSVLILAEVRKPGLKEFLQTMAKDLAAKTQPSTPVRIMDMAELAAAKDASGNQQLVILLRPDFVVAAFDIATLRSFNARLESKSEEFASTPFAQRLLQEYEGGTTVVAGADLQTILKQMPSGNAASQKTFQRSGFADMKYLIWEHKNVEGQAASQMELSFTGPRHGAAAWMLAPGPMGSLDFVSPKAVAALAVLLKNPAEIFDDVKEMATASDPNAFRGIEQMEQGMKLSLRNDVLARLTGEIAFELEKLPQPDAEWKAILRVNDPERLQAALTTLLSMAPVNPQQSEEDGITYHTLQVPSGQKPMEIGYAFVDGYLVVGSSRATVAEGVRLHRSGEALDKSKKFSDASLPGHLSEVSGLFYEDPMAMAALNLQRLSPQMVESFSKMTADATPVVVGAYGEESALREASRSGGVDVGVILVAAAVAIPNLLRARMAANESSAVATMRTLNTAQIIYSNTYPPRGFARDLATLGPDPRAPATPSADHASVIDATLGNPSCSAGTWCTKDGYQFTIKATCVNRRCNGYVVVGAPVSGSTGLRSFCSTSDAVVRYKAGSLLTASLTAAACRTWAPLQ